MKIAYIISAYTDPQNLKRLVEALGSQSFFIHVDKNVDEHQFKQVLNTCKNVHFIKDRVAVAWGGVTQVWYQCKMLQEVRCTGPYDRVVCITGTDYPVMSIKEIEDNFLKNPEMEFLCAEVVTGNQKLNQKVTRYWKFDFPFCNKKLSRLARGICNRIVGKTLWTVGIRKHDYFDYSSDSRWAIYFGSDYWALTYKCAMSVLDSLENNQDLMAYFSTAYAPSELVIPTIVCNSEYRENVQKIYKTEQPYGKLCALHYLIYDKTVRVMTENNYDDILQSGKMFFRKAKTGESDKLIQLLTKKRCEGTE